LKCCLRPYSAQENKKFAKYTARRGFEVLPVFLTAAGNISNPPGADLKFQTPYFCSWDAGAGMKGKTQV
jgi:hypothetical protein